MANTDERESETASRRSGDICDWYASKAQQQ